LGTRAACCCPIFAKIAPVLRFLFRQIGGISLEQSLQELEFFKLVDVQYRLALQLYQAIEPPLAINDAREYFFDRIGAVELEQLG
jgi:hypothetical protein